MPPPLQTLQAEFDEYVAAVYPDPRGAPYPAGPAYEALRRAFFGGCLVAYTSQADFMPDLNAWRDDLARNTSAFPVGKWATQ